MNRKLMTIAALSVVGVGISIYLLMVHWAIIGQAICLGVGDCEYVNTSRYSELFGIPVALLGGLTYITFIALCVLMMIYLGWQNWLRLFVWLAVGMCIYFLYSRHHSHLGKMLRGEISRHGVSPAGMPVDEP